MLNDFIGHPIFQIRKVLRCYSDKKIESNARCSPLCVCEQLGTRLHVFGPNKFGHMTSYCTCTCTSVCFSKNTTYLQNSSGQLGLDPTHSQCTQLSFPSLEPDLRHSCKVLLNHLLCQCSLSLIHFVGYEVDHSQLEESRLAVILLQPTGRAKQEKIS